MLGPESGDTPLVFHADDQRADRDLAAYTTMLVNPTENVIFVPDMETRPAILTNANISQNIPIQSLYTPTSTRAGLIILPRFASHATYTVSLEDNLVLPNLAPGAAGTSNMPTVLTGTYPIPIAYLKMSRVFAQSYTFLRPISSITKVSSATTSTTSAAISGVLHACAFNDLNDFSTFAQAELIDVAVTTKDYASQVPVYEGIAYTPGPEILQDFSNPTALPLIGDTATPAPTAGFSTYVSSYYEGTSAICYTTDILSVLSTTLNTGIVTFRPLSTARINLGSTLRIETKLRLNAAILSANLSVTVYALSTSTTGPIVKAFTVASFAPGTANTLNTAAELIDLTDQTTGYAGILLPFVSVTASATVTAVASNPNNVFEIVVTNLGQGCYRNCGPGGFIIADSLAAGQLLSIMQVVNYEAVPNGALAKDAKTSTYTWRNRDPMELSVAEAAFNSPNIAIRRINTGSNYNRSQQLAQSGISRGEILRNASFWSTLGNVAKGVGKIVAPMLPTIASAFGPEFAPIGQAAGSIIGALSRTSSGMDRAATGLDRGARSSSLFQNRKRGISWASPAEDDTTQASTEGKSEGCMPSSNAPKPAKVGKILRPEDSDCICEDCKCNCIHSDGICTSCAIECYTHRHYQYNGLAACDECDTNCPHDFFHCENCAFNCAHNGHMLSYPETDSEDEDPYLRMPATPNPYTCSSTDSEDENMAPQTTTPNRRPRQRFATNERSAGGAYVSLSKAPVYTVVNPGVQPENQLPIADAIEASETNFAIKVNNVIAGHKQPLAEVNYALFPTVMNEVGRVEKIFVSRIPVRSIGLAYDDEETSVAAEVDSVYAELAYTITSTSGKRTNTIFVSTDFQNEELAAVVEVCTYFNVNNAYITAPSDGRITGRSFMLALASACLGLPPACALTGALEFKDYPEIPIVRKVGDIKVKIQACINQDLKLLAPLATLLDDNGKFLGLTVASVVGMTDIINGDTANGDWIAAGINILPELAIVITSIVLSAPRTVMGKDGNLVYKPYGTVEVQTIPSYDDIKRIYNLVPSLADKWIKEIDRKDNKLKPTDIAVLAGAIVGELQEPFKNFSVNIGGINYTLKNRPTAQGEQAVWYSKLKKATMYHLLADPAKGINTIGPINAKYRKEIRKIQVKNTPPQAVVKQKFKTLTTKTARESLFNKITGTIPTTTTQVTNRPSVKDITKQKRTPPTSSKTQKSLDKKRNIVDDEDTLMEEIPESPEVENANEVFEDSQDYE
jgi:hypothetical protein